jgi:DNA helicase-2/ATP-dependent DNA helicase PcrA
MNTMTIDFSGLNERQREAAFAKGIVRIIAGAGSGKTKALTYRAGRLIEEGVAPENILSITFTKKAALEMQGRLRKLIGEKADRLACGTFHSICYRILRVSGGLNGFNILDDYKQMLYLESVIGPDGLNLDMKAGGFKYAISMAKNRLLDAQGFAESAEDYSSGIIKGVFAL